MKKLNKFVAMALAVCMVCSFGLIGASAAGPYAEGDYTATATFLHEEKDQPSMCNVLFDHDADIIVRGDSARITVYAANPVPAFPDQGADGTVKNVVMTIDGVNYPAKSDITSKPMREMDETNPAFGVEAGQSLPTQVISFTIPADKLDTLATSPAETSAYVNVVMMTNVVFRLKIENITPVGGSVEPEQPAVPDETQEQSMNITAEVAAPVPAPAYSFTIPESIDLGTLSAEQDNEVAYTVDVVAENLGSGKVVVSAAAEGSLQSADSVMAYTNTFGSQETSVTATLNGAFQVAASAVKAAASGTYTGVATFTVSYFAGK